MSTLVALTYARVRSETVLDEFLQLAVASIDAAHATPGNRGVHVTATAPLEWYTMSGWADEDALASFVHTDAHDHAMQRADDLLEETRFERCRVDGSLEALTWPEVLTRFG